MTFKACIFDLDGVITDLDQHIHACWLNVAEKLNYNLGEKQYHKLRPLSAKDSLDKILKWSLNRISEAEKQQILIELNKQYLNSIDGMSPEDMIPGFKSFNEKLRARGIKVAIATTTKHAIRVIDRLDLVLDFDAIVDGGMVSEPADCNKVLTAVVEKLQLEAPDCAFISQSELGIAAAAELGMQINPNRAPQKKTHLESISNWNNATIEDLLEHSS